MVIQLTKMPMSVQLDPLIIILDHACNSLKWLVNFNISTENSKIISLCVYTWSRCFKEQISNWKFLGYEIQLSVFCSHKRFFFHI
jgi:hypothetical protein